MGQYFNNNTQIYLNPYFSTNTTNILTQTTLTRELIVEMSFCQAFEF